MVKKKLRGDGGFGWWEEYEVLRGKCELGMSMGQCVAGRKTIQMINEMDCRDAY